MTPLLEALCEAAKLKAVHRAGWKRVGIERPESVASHSWGMSMLAMTLCPPELDLSTVLSFCTLHDLPEVHTGDITPHDGVSREDKHRLEEHAMTLLCERLPSGSRLLQLWKRYEAQSCEESKYVKQLDRLDMAVQALVYAPVASTMEFVQSAARGITDPALLVVVAEIETELALALHRANTKR